jgi:hypothetical protein
MGRLILIILLLAWFKLHAIDAKNSANNCEIALDKGTSKPRTCKFPVSVDSIEVTEIIEVLPVSNDAELSISSVPVWSAR